MLCDIGRRLRSARSLDLPSKKNERKIVQGDIQDILVLEMGICDAHNKTQDNIDRTKFQC